jgi:hypothetical protein
MPQLNINFRERYNKQIETKPWMMLVAMMAGWLNQQQQNAIVYLKEENNISRAELLKAIQVRNE